MNLEDRVVRLERQNWRLRMFSFATGLGLLAVVIMGAEPARTADRVQITDRHGRIRIDAHAHPDFGPMIRLLDNDNNERMRIGSDQNAGGKPFIWFFDPGLKRVKTIEP